MVSDGIIWFATGMVFVLVVLFAYWEYVRRKNELVLDDPTDDEDYLEIKRKLKCPDCHSYDYRTVEVDDLPWLKDEDTYCICNVCGRQFGDGK